MRLFKILGDIATAFIITGIAKNYNKLVFFGAVSISMPYILYRLTYVFIVLKEVFRIFKNKEYQVRK